MSTIANLASYRGVIKCWGREREHLRLTWDFAVDGGAVGEYPLFKAGEKLIVESAKMVSKTAVVATTSGTISVGKASDLAGIIAATGAGDLEADEVAFGAAQDASHVLAVDAIVYMAIATDALTAGKVDFLFELQKA